MPQISLTDLVEITSAAGMSKARKVAAIKRRPAYNPAFDFYKPLREEMAKMHRQGRDIVELRSFADKVSDRKKVGNYQNAIDGYLRWCSKKAIEWFEPARGVYSKHGVEVSVNPELGVSVDGKRHLVKLYFKDEPLQRLRTDVVTVLMEASLRDACHGGEAMALLDVRKGKLFPLQVSLAETRAVVDAELAYVADLWRSI
jgi:hypothetical protein